MSLPSSTDRHPDVPADQTTTESRSHTVHNAFGITVSGLMQTVQVGKAGVMSIKLDGA
jgi:hypothetical protein